MISGTYKAVKQTESLYKKWLKNPVRFVAMTGYSIEQFLMLLPYFDKAHQHYFSRYDLGGNKKKEFRKFVIYSNSPLPTVADRLAFIFFQKLRVRFRSSRHTVSV